MARFFKKTYRLTSMLSGERPKVNKLCLVFFLVHRSNTKTIKENGSLGSVL